MPTTAQIGTDIVYIPRIAAVVEQFGQHFLDKVYTPQEQQDAKRSARQINSRLAGRWAAKEAAVKALGTGWRGVGYRDVEIKRKPSGAPTITLHNRALALVHTRHQENWEWQVSFSHDGDYAIATAIFAPSVDSLSSSTPI
ncbi:holo-ACP synthase [Leptolyngbya sp. FACHB-261]|nr:holo-ACP synthase [Leptolyngbya sp. FACHB-261]